MGMCCCECIKRIDAGDAIAIYRLGTNQEGLKIPNEKKDIVPPNGYVCRDDFKIPMFSLKKTPNGIEGLVYGVAFERELGAENILDVEVICAKTIGTGVDMYVSEKNVRDYQSGAWRIIEEMEYNRRILRSRI